MNSNSNISSEFYTVVIGATARGLVRRARNGENLKAIIAKKLGEWNGAQSDMTGVKEELERWIVYWSTEEGYNG